MRHLVNAYEVKIQAWQKVMVAYRRGWLKKSPVGWLPVHRYAPGPLLGNEYGRTLLYFYVPNIVYYIIIIITMLHLAIANFGLGLKIGHQVSFGSQQKVNPKSVIIHYFAMILCQESV